MTKYKLAFSSLGCPDYSVEEIVKACGTYGYSGVSLRTVRGNSLLPALPEFSAEGLAATASLFRGAGVSVLCVASGVRFTAAEASVREKELETAKAYIDIAAALGSPYVRVFGGPYPDDRPRAEVLPNIVEGFRRTCDYATDKGVAVLLETHDSFSRGTDAADLVRRVERDNLFIVWDILHSLRFGESLTDTWRRVGPFVRHVHLKDSTNFDETKFDLNLLGRGRVPLREAVALLLESGYRGYFEFEWEKGWHPDIPGPAIAFPHGAGYLEGLLAGMSADDA